MQVQSTTVTYPVNWTTAPAPCSCSMCKSEIPSSSRYAAMPSTGAPYCSRCAVRSAALTAEMARIAERAEQALSSSLCFECGSPMDGGECHDLSCVVGWHNVTSAIALDMPEQFVLREPVSAGSHFPTLSMVAAA